MYRKSQVLLDWGLSFQQVTDPRAFVAAVLNKDGSWAEGIQAAVDGRAGSRKEPCPRGCCASNEWPLEMLCEGAAFYMG